MEQVRVPLQTADAVPVSSSAIRDTLSSPEAIRVFDFFSRVWKAKLGPRRPNHEVGFAVTQVTRTNELDGWAVRPGHVSANGLPEANLHRVLILSECGSVEDRTKLRAFHRRIGKLVREKEFRAIGPRIESEYRVQNAAEPPPNFGRMCSILAAYICSLPLHPDIRSPSAFRHTLNLLAVGNIPFRWEEATASILFLAA